MSGTHRFLFIFVALLNFGLVESVFADPPARLAPVVTQAIPATKENTLVGGGTKLRVYGNKLYVANNVLHNRGAAPGYYVNRLDGATWTPVFTKNDGDEYFRETRCTFGSGFTVVNGKVVVMQFCDSIVPAVWNRAPSLGLLVSENGRKPVPLGERLTLPYTTTLSGELIGAYMLDIESSPSGIIVTGLNQKTSEMLVYRFNNGSWEDISPDHARLPQQISRLGNLVVDGSSIYVVIDQGNGSHFQPTVIKYDEPSKKWLTIFQALNLPSKPRRDSQVSFASKNGKQVFSFQYWGVHSCGFGCEQTDRKYWGVYTRNSESENWLAVTDGWMSRDSEVYDVADVNTDGRDFFLTISQIYFSFATIIRDGKLVANDSYTYSLGVNESTVYKKHLIGISFKPYDPHKQSAYLSRLGFDLTDNL